MKILNWLKKISLYKNKYIYKEALFFLEFVLKKNIFWILINKNFFLKKKYLLCLNIFLIRRLRGEPFSYIIGKVYFLNIIIKIYFDIFIPRKDTEVMVEYIFFLIKREKYILNLLDLGIGSGSIALSIAKNFRYIKVIGVDKNLLAVNLAKYNAQKLKLYNVDFFYSNWFSNKNIQCNYYDIIVSNPPYIDKNSFFLFKGDLRYESSLSLISDNYGVNDLYIIIKDSFNFLRNNGWLIVEYGFDIKNIIYDFFIKFSYRNIKLFKDYNNIYRFIIGQK